MRSDSRDPRHGKYYGDQLGGKKATFRMLDHTVQIRLPTTYGGSHIPSEASRSLFQAGIKKNVIKGTGVSADMPTPTWSSPYGLGQ